MTTRSASLTVGALLGSLLGALSSCQSQPPALEEVRGMLALGEVEQAYWTLARAVEANPGDEELRRQLAELRPLYLLARGQEHVFNDRDWQAVEDFERVLLAEPDNAVAKSWRDKALEKLATREVELGDTARKTGHLEQALDHYHRALTYVPEFRPAQYGQSRVSDVLESRRTKGSDNYLRGMRAQAEGLFEQTRYHMDIALDNDPALTMARERRQLARRRLAEGRLQRAAEALENGWYQSALQEYRTVYEAFPDLDPELPVKIEAMQREVDAENLVSVATLASARKDFAKARKLFEEAFNKSTEQRIDISDHLVALRESELEARYGLALDHELDHRYREALAGYKEIEEGWPGQLDIRARVQDLESRLEAADEAVARAEVAEKEDRLEDAVAAYRDALLYAPKYLDLEARIAALHARLPPKAEQESKAEQEIGSD